jgi:glucose/arabinose dehydrogenase/cytochrome c5
MKHPQRGKKPSYLFIIFSIFLISAVMAGCGAAETPEQTDMAPTLVETGIEEPEPTLIEETEAPTEAMTEAPTEMMETPTTDETGEPVPETGMDGGTVSAPLENQQPIGLEMVAEGLTSPVFLTAPDDGSGRVFIVDQVGQIRILDENGDLLDDPFLDVSDRMVELREEFDERGLLGLAFHPDYANNGLFYVYYSAPLREDAPADWNHTATISEFAVSADDPNMADADSERVMLQVDEPQFNHDGGTVAFGPDGFLYISFGDGGGANDSDVGHVEDWYEENAGGNGQDITDNLLGSILRIDVDNLGAADQPYGIPVDNPFAEMSGEDTPLPEIYAYGFRNPYRFSFDRGGENQLFAADVGQNAYEEVNIVEAGGNYGWNVKEGTHCFSTETPNEPLETCPDTDPEGNPLIDPVIEYVNNNQENGIGISVTGGYVYRGSQMPELEGNYVFGDWSMSFQEPSGRLFVSEPQDSGLWPITELVPQGMDFNYFVLGFGEDADGELYVTTTQNTGPSGNTGAVFRLVPGGEMDGDMQETPETTPTAEAGSTPAAGDGDQDPAVQQGQQVFTNVCTACHGDEGEANIGPALAGNELVTQSDPTEVISVVLNGRGQMPPFEGQLTNEEIAHVVSYIRNAWENDASIVTPDEVEQVADS